jgi:hypothetical protein
MLFNFSSRDRILYVGFEVLTAVVIKSYIFWDMTLCSPLKVNLHFGVACHLHLQGSNISMRLISMLKFKFDHNN